MLSTRLRQTFVTPGWRIFCLSVVSKDSDQVRKTLSPLRTARRSLTGRASSSDGGMGGPGLPQPAATPEATRHRASFSPLTFIPWRTEYHRGQAVRSGMDGLGLAGEQLPEDVLQDAAICVIERLLGSVDAHRGLKLFRGALFVDREHFDPPRGAEVRNDGRNSADLEALLAGNFERLSILSGQKLERQNAHTDKVRAVNALVAFGNNRAYTEQPGSFRCPVAGRPRAVLSSGNNDEWYAFADVLFRGLED